MNDFITVIPIAFFIILFILIFVRLFRVYTEKRAADNISSFRTQKDESGKTVFVRCPVCNTPLTKDENMVSRIFRPMNTPDQRMFVMGCPHCYPTAKNGIKRICPVCNNEVSADGYLVARLFNLKTAKKHVVITGCNVCCSHSSKKS